MNAYLSLIILKSLIITNEEPYIIFKWVFYRTKHILSTLKKKIFIM